MRLIWAALVMAMLGGLLPSAPLRAQPAGGESRLALVIGNGAYKHQPLRNPANDAREMAIRLRRFGFTVIELIDVGRSAMESAVLEFGEKLKAGGVGLFFYAGHGIQTRGQNYLIPVDATLTSEASVRVQGVDVALVLDLMTDSRNRANVVILDACRNNPYMSASRGSKGLAAIDAARGTLIAYSTAPGAVAVDGEGTSPHSPYTKALIDAIDEPGLRVEDIFKKVRGRVVDATKGAQTPWESSSLTGDLIINLNVTVAPAAPAAAAPPGRDPADLAFWTTIQASKDPRDYEDYLKQFPAGTFSGLAQRRADDLNRQRLAAAEDERKRAVAIEQERQRKADEEDRRRKQAEEAEKRRLAAEAEKQRLAELETDRKRKAEETERQRAAAAEAENRRKADDEERRRKQAEEVEKRRLAAEAEKQRLADLEAARQRKAEEAALQREAEAEKQRLAAEQQKAQEAEAAEARRRAELEAERARAESERAQAAQRAETASVPKQEASLPPGNGLNGTWTGKSTRALSCYKLSYDVRLTVSNGQVIGVMPIEGTREMKINGSISESGAVTAKLDVSRPSSVTGHLRRDGGELVLTDKRCWIKFEMAAPAGAPAG